MIRATGGLIWKKNNYSVESSGGRGGDTIKLLNNLEYIVSNSVTH